jgi:hypothetical protein
MLVDMNPWGKVPPSTSEGRVFAQAYEVLVRIMLGINNSLEGQLKSGELAVMFCVISSILRVFVYKHHRNFASGYSPLLVVQGVCRNDDIYAACRALAILTA